MKDTFGRAVVHVWDALVDDRWIVVKIVIELALVDQLRVISVGRLHLDGYFEIGFRVYGLVDLPEGAFVNLTNDFEVFAHFFKHLWHALQIQIIDYTNKSIRCISSHEGIDTI